MGDLATARQFLERSVETLQRVLGPDHPHTARVVHRLALVLRDQGELTEALRLHQSALATLERAFGPEHQFTMECRRAMRAVTPGL